MQGGGALGAYQAGVYHALHEHGIEPDWIIGTSIGAINASLIAGNPGPIVWRQLKEFWTRMAYRPPFGVPAWTGLPDTLAYWKTLLRGIPAFFEPNPGAFLGTQVPLGAEGAGFYSTAPLEKTLLELVDFSLVNKCKPRLTVGAAHVRTSEMRYFDSRDGELGVKHIMASGALPPAFPAVRIDGELYWDGGILSNTPTEAIFDDNPRKNSLIFAVHLWNPMGEEPGTIWEVLNRQKDIQYSSRVASHIARQRQLHHMRHIINDLAKMLPDDVRKSPEARRSPPTAARRSCTSCGCWRRNSKTRTTPRTSTSARPASGSAGRPATPRPCARSIRRRGRTRSIRSRASSCTNRSRKCWKRPSRAQQIQSGTDSREKTCSGMTHRDWNGTVGSLAGPAP